MSNKVNFFQKRENTMKENSISVEGKLAEIFKKLSKGDTMDEVIVIYILFIPFIYFIFLVLLSKC